MPLLKLHTDESTAASLARSADLPKPEPPVTATILESVKLTPNFSHSAKKNVKPGWNRTNEKCTKTLTPIAKDMQINC
jgi:hypothetical protein